jgi:hypothetical protein
VTGSRDPGRGRRWLIVSGLAAVVTAVVVGVVLVSPAARSGKPAPPPASGIPREAKSLPALPPPPGAQFGASVNHLFNDGTYSPAQVDAQLAALRATGATLARSDALWEATEPQPPVDGAHHYSWTFDDAIATALATHGLSWLPILDYSAPWAQSIPGQDHSPPRSDADYADYAQAFAHRYGTGGSFWRAHPGLPGDPVQTIEIWNEPDNPQFWTPSPDPAGYADLYLAARRAIDVVDPGTRVIVGGLTDPTGFLPAMMRAQPQLQGHIDGVAIHPYGSPPVLLSRIRNARATLSSLGMAATPLYVTEFGWTTAPAGATAYVPAARRPAYILQTLAELGHLNCGLAASVLYAWTTLQRNRADGGDWYGIHDPDGASTPSSSAFAAGLRAAVASAPEIDLCPR